MTWRQLLGRAIVAEGSQSAVARRLGYSPSAISAVLGGNYNGSAKAIEAAVRNIYGGKTVTEQAVPAGYKRNAIGHLVPIESIKDEDLLRDEFVQRVIEQAIELATVISAFKTRLGEDMQALMELAFEKYGAKIGGERGNVTLTSFDGKYQILRAVSDQLDFDERLQAAKALIDECLREWTKDSRSEIRALIESAFQVDKKGKINSKRILALRSLKIEDPVWKRAMEAISDAVTVIGSRTYYRLYERDEHGNYRQIPMDFSGV